MRYNVAWKPPATEVFDRLPPISPAHLLDLIDELAESPTSLSRRGGFPCARRDQRFECDVESYFVIVFFQYSQDEQTLCITDLGLVQR